MLRALRLEGPLKTVVHAAMVLDDALIENLTEERVRLVIEPKARAAAIFDRMTREDELDEFILFSSATTLVGNPGQANYVAANGYLEGLARARRKLGLPALAVGFGAISDTGFLARNTDVNDMLSKRIGKTGMTAAQALDYVEDHLARDPGTVDAAVVAIAELDMAMARHLRTVASPLVRSGGAFGEFAGKWSAMATRSIWPRWSQENRRRKASNSSSNSSQVRSHRSCAFRSAIFHR